MQVRQIERMIANKEKVLVVSSVDGTALSDVMKKAADAGIPVIAYDRLIMNSPNVDYYASHDNFKTGVLQGQSIVHGLGLDTGKTGPFNIELLAGPATDNNAKYFFNGAMSVLLPLIDDGRLVVQSKQTTLDAIATPNWDFGIARVRLASIIEGYYRATHIDAVLSPVDVFSVSAVIPALKSAGYGSKDLPMPIITGQDGQVDAVKAIIAGDQYSTVFKDTRELAKVTAAMVDAVASGGKPEINDTSYSNGVKIVPAYLVNVVTVDANNWKSELVDSGYYVIGAFQ